MVVAIGGAHGKIAMRLTALLTADGDSVVGPIRNSDYAREVGERGASPVVCDLERATSDEVATAISGADAAVFAAEKSAPSESWPAVEPKRSSWGRHSSSSTRPLRATPKPGWRRPRKKQKGQPRRQPCPDANSTDGRGGQPMSTTPSSAGHRPTGPG